MQERIIEIIVYVLEEFRQVSAGDTYTDLSAELISRGYTENEINLAFSWIFTHLEKSNASEETEFSYTPGSTRILHDLEKLVISPDAYGYLLQLFQLGMITENDLEDLIERALSTGSTNVTLEDIKSIAASLIFNMESGNSVEGFFFHNGSNTIH